MTYALFKSTVGTRQLHRAWSISRMAYCASVPLDGWCHNREPYSLRG